MGGYQDIPTYRGYAPPTYAELSRAKSDESLLWNAGEAEMLVAELRASITTAEECRIIIQQPSTISSFKSRSVADLSLSGSLEDMHRQETCPGTLKLISGSISRPNYLPIGDVRKKMASRVSNKSKYLGGSWRSIMRLGGMTSRGKSVPSAKKVSPPTVPQTDSGSSSSASSTCSSHRHSGSSLSSGVYSSTSDQRASYCSAGDESMVPPSSPTRDTSSDHGSISDASTVTVNSICTRIGTLGGTAVMSSPSHFANQNAVTSSPSYFANQNAVTSSTSYFANQNLVTSSPSHFANQHSYPAGHQGPPFAHLMCAKISPGSPHHIPQENPYTYTPYQQRTPLDDQGIDVQSPGRSSPGSGSSSSTTGSTASSGNCRNSTTSLDSGRASASTHTTHTHRLSGHSYDSNSFMRHSYHSSSSSIGSMEPDSTASANVQELMRKGVPDVEVLRAWLCDLRLDEYYDNFLSAGYDMPTISRMTPEDLNAIGITKPTHRKRLKAEINRLNIYDGLPDFIPSRLEEWLKMLHLDEYSASMKQQKYLSVEQFTQITWEDLEDVGITKLGHQKKVMLAIKRAKDIMSGKLFRIAIENGKLPVMHESVIHGKCNDSRVSIPGYNMNGQLINDFRRSGPPDPGGHPGPYIPVAYPTYVSNSFLHMHPSQRYHAALAQSEKVKQMQQNILHYRPDVVAVQVRPNQRSNTNEPIYSTFLPEHRMSRSFKPLPPFRQSSTPNRSLDDGDITPTNETPFYQVGGGTLPRPYRLVAKQRPVAMVTAKTRVEVHEPPKSENFIKPPIPVDSNKINGGTPKGTPKKLPPPLPKRSNSISESSKPPSQSPFAYLQRGISQGYIQTSLQPEVTPNLPPPPPAPEDKGNHQHLPEDFPPPPPPLTCLNLARNSTVNASLISTSPSDDGSSESEKHYRPQRNESNSSIKSNSSNESGESLPFANDNAGTIKQRINRNAFSLLDKRGSPRASPLSSPALRRKEGIVLPIIRQPMFISSNDTICEKNNSLNDNSSAQPANDVLSDIGNMLTNLTNELDAMIEQDRPLS